MTRHSLLLVGLVALMIALAMTGVLSSLRVGEMVEVFPLPPDTLELPLGPEMPAEAAVISPQAAVTASAPTFAAGLLSAAVLPTTAILQAGRDGYSGCSDTYIQFYRPTENYCESSELYMVTGNKAATLLKFDLTNLPENILGLDSDAVILQATLDIYAVEGNKGAVMGIYLPYGPWDSCAVTWDAPWETAGADGLADRESQPRVEGTTQQAPGWMTFDVTGLVQHWLREPTQNHGMIIKSFDLSVPSHHIFFSCDHPSQDVRPQLTIRYEAAPQAPMPAETATSALTPSETALPTETAMAGATSKPAVAETATPMPTPTLILPLSPRVIELHWHNQMDIGASYPIQVIFRPETAATGGSINSYVLSVFAEVTAAAFDVVPNSPAEQLLEQPEDILSWSWQVEPRIIGSQTLSLDLLFSWRPATNAAPAIANDSGTWYQTKVIKVVRPFRYWTHMTMLRNLLLVIAMACLVGWYMLKRRTRGRSVVA